MNRTCYDAEIAPSMNAILVNALGEFAGREWDHAITLTFGNPASTDGAVVEAKRFIRRLENLAGNPVNYFGSVEAGNLNGRNHSHLVVHGTKNLSVAEIGKVWVAGHQRVRIYDADGAFAYYSAKNLPAGDAELLLFDRRKLTRKDRGRFRDYYKR
jgi:hypothetical protein